MKKQILFFAVSTSAVLFSCTKERIETTSASELPQGAQNSIVVEDPGPIYIDPLKVGLEGWFDFNGNLKDKMNKLADGYANTRAGAIYTFDRKGNSNSALYINGYGVDISDVPQQTNTSLTAWVKSSTFDHYYFITSNGSGPMMSQDAGKFWGVVGIQAFGTESAPMGSIDTKWRHLAVTFDGATIRVYRDGNLMGTQSFVSPISPGLKKYRLGYRPELPGYWKGTLDDLRFYSRTLSAAEVKSLATF